MLLRCFNRATQCPELLVEDILSGTLDWKGLVIATEALGFINDTTLSYPVIQRQLQNGDVLVVEAAIMAMRILAMRQSVIFSAGFREILIHMATSAQSASLRIYAAEALADFAFSA